MARPSGRLGIRLATEMVVWSSLLPLLKRTLPLPRLVAVMWTAGGEHRSNAQERRIIALSARVARIRPRVRSNCLERSLLAYRFLARAGADPRLVLGVASDEDDFVGHAWVTLDGEPIHESRAAVADFVPLVEFGPKGRATDMGDSSNSRALPRVWR